MQQQPHIDHRVREFAYQIWESEGKPDGQAERHWDMACQLAEAQNLGQQLLNGDADGTKAKTTRARKKADEPAAELVAGTEEKPKATKKAAADKPAKVAKTVKADKAEKPAKATKTASAAKVDDTAEKPKKAKKTKAADTREASTSESL